jgi:uncharacterized membrane protein YgcG
MGTSSDVNTVYNDGMKLLKLFALSILLFVGLAPKLAAQNVQDFDIRSFEADYYISRNDQQTAIMKVEEEIVAEFPAFNQNRGILRALPKEYNDNTLSLKILSVTNEQGVPYQYSTYEENGNEVLKIGDPDSYVLGRNTYKITYEYRNVINFQALDELFWDVNGDQWYQPFDSIVARVHIPEDLVSALTDQQRCTGGYYGANDSTTCTITRQPQADGDLVVEVASTKRYLVGQTMTFVLGFEKGTFQLGPEIAAEKRRDQFILALMIGPAFLLPVITMVVMIYKWSRYGRDSSAKDTIVPEYIPPKGMSVMASNVIVHEQLQPKAMGAAIVELAVRHYIVIKEEFKDKFIGSSREFELELKKDTSDLAPEQLKLVNALFTSPTVGATVKLKGLRYKLAKDFKDIGEDLSKRLYEQGYFRTDPNKTRKQYSTIGGVIFVLGFGAMFTGFLAPLGVGLMLSGVIVLLFAGKMPARSAKGVEARNYVKGLEEYMKLAEDERINFSQGLTTAERVKAGDGSAADKIKLFERLLPYAILFGIEKDWAKQFAELYQTQPDWYTGNVNAFTAAHLGSSLASLGSVSAASFSNPSSSGGSGFGGGGFSGGGGGGGGGGGW